MKTARLEAFSDGVLAIIITIMVLELKVPHEPTLAALGQLAPVFLSYLLSFVYVGIYWNNHHHLLHATTQVSGKILWLNLHLLFWLSLVPFTTGWMGENHFESVPSALYGLVLLGSAVAYSLLQHAIVAHEGKDSPLAKSLHSDWKGKLSPVLYLSAIWLSFVNEPAAFVLYFGVAGMWFIPDRRIEHAVEETENQAKREK